MACIRERRGRWVLDYRDASGMRRWETYRTKREAEDALAAALPATRQIRVPSVDPSVTVQAYAERWLKLCANLKPATIRSYSDKLECHILPALGTIKLRRLARTAIKDLLAEKRATSLSFDSVRLIHATLRAMLNAAVDDGVIASNPAAGLSRSMRLARSTQARAERIKAFDRDQLGRFLQAAKEKTPSLYPLFYLLSRTGLRLGEGLALEWGDFDLKRREVRVARSVSASGAIDTPKSGHGRSVDLSASVCELVRRRKARDSEAALARGESLGQYVFSAAKGAGEPMPHVTAQKGCKRALTAAGLPGHFSCHSLRHTYASLLLQDGVSPAYVQEQLGHASIELTVGTYGRWLRKRAPGAVDQLDRLDHAPNAPEHESAPNEVVAETQKVVAVEPNSSKGRRDRRSQPADSKKMAEREGFEPSVPGLPVLVISSHADSATLASLREPGGRGHPRGSGPRTLAEREGFEPSIPLPV